MKKCTKIILGTAFAAATCLAVTAGYIAYIKNKDAVLPEGFTVTAHTGCEGTADNSLEAIETGYLSGADIVEFDVHFNSEGEPVLAHDYAADDSVKLRDAFEFIAKCEGLRVNVDCKTTDNLKAITAIAEECGVKDRIFYTGIEVKNVKTVKADTPEIEYYLNTKIDKTRINDEHYIRSLVTLTKAVDARGLNIHFSNASKKMVKIFHSEGLEVSVWTVNKEFDMYKVLHLGCDNITTRQPSMLKEIIANKTK
ncbi:MAG: glycerophosphodiester phosphodiesterase [Clostridia bacterium]|nr:glycerophosphodiester phosphodiesterase [Clostridia bacterium]